MFELLKQTDQYKAQLEWNEGVPFLHLSVYEWSPQIYKEMLDGLDWLKEHLAAKGIPFFGAYSIHQNDKWYKFMDKFPSDLYYYYQGLRVYIFFTGVEHGH